MERTKFGDAGTEREFEELATAEAAGLYRSAWLLCGHREQAEDLVQETLAKVYDRMTRRFGTRIDNPAAYAHTTLVRTFLSARRLRSSTELPYADLPDVAGPDPAGGVDLRLALREALADLSSLDRAVVVLRYLEDRPVDEAAGLLGLSPGAVRNRSMRALARMRERSLL